MGRNKFSAQEIKEIKVNEQIMIPLLKGGLILVTI